jgi:hypothetical protein
LLKQVVHVVVTELERVKEEDTNVTVPDSLLADGSERFSCGMAILNLIIRPFTTLVLYRIYVERANAAGAPLPAIFGESLCSSHFCIRTGFVLNGICPWMGICHVGTNVFVAFAGGTAQRGPYEDIVGGVHQSVPHTDIPSPMEYPPNSKMPPAYHS